VAAAASIVSRKSPRQDVAHARLIMQWAVDDEYNHHQLQLIWFEGGGGVEPTGM